MRLDHHAPSSAGNPTSLHQLGDLVERRLGSLVPAVAGDGLVAAIRYALLAPGKRLRPILTILAASELGGSRRAALDAGCALEMVHAASLILDDLPCMDDAMLRRGQPATHVAFGEATAALAAVTLLSRAHAVLAAADGPAPEARCRLVAILDRAIGTDGLAGGQHRDLQGQPSTDVAEIAHANALKTGALFVASVAMACEIASADAATRFRLAVFAEHLGHAFQLLDDMSGALDSDEDAGKPTVLAALGLRETESRLRVHVESARREIAPYPSLVAVLDGLFGEIMRERAA